MNRITIVGTGWSAGQLTLDAVSALTGGAKVILHTGRSACAGWLEEKGVAYETLDALYESCEDFDEHAERAARAVMDAAREAEVVYGVFDVRDRSAVRITSLAEEEVRVIAGPPAEGALFSLAQGEIKCVEASDWEDFRLTARENCFIRELDSRELASEVKLRLMEVYPEEEMIWLMCGGDAPVSVPLYEMDRGERYDHMTCALVPAQRDIMKLERYDMGCLEEIMRFLCSPQGCPWDRVQTHKTLRPYILEEAYEVIDAIDEGSPEHLYDELGDMLLQIALHAEIARKHGEFDMSDVTTAICEKMISRHSHVFGSDHAGNAEEVLGLWSKNKMKERGQATRADAMRDVTRALPATLRSAKVLKRAWEVGIGAKDPSEAIGDAMPRLEKLGKLSKGDPGAEAVLGDALMYVCDAARQLGLDPELALNGAVSRFIGKFEKVEAEIAREYGGFDMVPAEKLRKYWELVKL